MIACSLCKGTRRRECKLTERRGLVVVRVLTYTAECACARHRPTLIKD